jgi:colanic acid/amylovoran biosynthesis glycosyltransferase
MMTTDPSGHASQDGYLHQQRPRLAYLLSIYPAVSHTFFLNEITELRKLGFDIDVASINKPVLPPGKGSDLELAAIENTFYIKSGKAAAILLRLLAILVTQPVTVSRGLRAALQLERWNLPATCYSLFYLAEALLIGDWMRRRGHNHLHIHFGGPVATVGMLTSITWQFPYSIMFHGPEVFYDVEKFYLRQKVERARFVLCISDYCRSQVMKVSDPAHWGKIRVVRLGVDLKAFAPNPVLDHDGPTEIICVGRMVPAKGHLILVHAISHLVQSGLNVCLRLIGDGPERSSIESLIAEEKLESHVVLEGALNHEATRQKLAKADVFVLASFAEGLPVALMEAMAMELPCVTTFVAGIPELIRDGIEGILVPPSSTQALAAALERLVRDPELRHRFGKAGRSRVLERYDLEQNVSRLADTMCTLVAPHIS